MRAIVINCSAKHYNLGQSKIADWLKEEGHIVDLHSGDPGLFAYGYDLVCLWRNISRARMRWPRSALCSKLIRLAL